MIILTKVLFAALCRGHKYPLELSMEYINGTNSVRSADFDNKFFLLK